MPIYLIIIITIYFIINFIYFIIIYFFIITIYLIFNDGHILAVVPHCAHFCAPCKQPLAANSTNA